MQKIILPNGEVKEVENNEAHSLIEAGKAKLFEAGKKIVREMKRVKNKMQKRYLNKGF